MIARCAVFLDAVDAKINPSEKQDEHDDDYPNDRAVRRLGRTEELIGRLVLFGHLSIIAPRRTRLDLRAVDNRYFPNLSLYIFDAFSSAFSASCLLLNPWMVTSTGFFLSFLICSKKC